MGKKGLFKLVASLALIVLLIAVLFMYYSDKFGSLFSTIDTVASNKAEVDLAKCNLACNKDKNIAQEYETCDAFEQEYYNEQRATFCESCTIMTNCNITINEEQCSCKLSPEQQIIPNL